MYQIALILALMGVLSGCAMGGRGHGEGGYTGAHGVGLIVDNPDEADDDPENWPVCSNGVRYPDCRNAPAGY